MKIFVVLTCLVVLSTSLAHSESEKGDYYFGAGLPFYNTNELLSESMISINKFALYGLRSFDGEERSSDWLSVGYRVARSIGVDFPISLYAAEIPHEFLGHGFPALNYGGKIDRVDIGFPPLPYDLSYSSSTTTSGANVPADIADQWSNHQKANGIQVENSMSHLIRNKYWRANTVDYDLSILLLKTAYAPGWYVLFKPPGSTDTGNVDSSNDIAAIAARYSNASGEHYTTSEIRNKSFIYNSLNPMVLWSWYEVFKYIATGKPKTKLPYVSVFGNKWLPALSYTVTGYGEEYVLSNYFQTAGGKSGSLETAVGTVDNNFRTSIFLNNLLGGAGKKYEVGTEVHYWSQSSDGIAAFVDLHYDLFGSKTSGVYAKAGYKSFGFLRGYGLKEGGLMGLGVFQRF